MSETAAAIIRQSKGVEDSISLSQQREKVGELANEVADTVETIDFGVYTGFSIHMKGDEDERIDNHPDMVDLLDDLRNGKYDYLCALDDTRVARDQFYWEIKRAAEVGGCELEYVRDRPEDRLTFRVQRAVESEVKIKEIEKAVEAVEIRKEKGHYQGSPPFGTCFDQNGEYLVKDKEEWSALKTIFQGLDDGRTYRELEDETGVSIGTISRIKDRGRGYYEQYGELRTRGEVL